MYQLNRYGLFAVIKAIFSNQNDLDMIMNYIQTIISIKKNKIIDNIEKKHDQGMVTGFELTTSMTVYKRFIHLATNIYL